MPLLVEGLEIWDYSNTSVFTALTIHTMDRHGNECLLSSLEFYGYGILLYLECGYVVSNLPREWCSYKQQVQMLTQGYECPQLANVLGTNLISQRGDPMEVSLNMVPPNHPLLAPRNLEAEASGLLDRMLSVFQESTR